MELVCDQGYEDTIVARENLKLYARNNTILCAKKRIPRSRGGLRFDYIHDLDDWELSVVVPEMHVYD